MIGWLISGNMLELVNLHHWWYMIFLKPRTSGHCQSSTKMRRPLPGPGVPLNVGDSVAVVGGTVSGLNVNATDGAGDDISPTVVTNGIESDT